MKCIQLFLGVLLLALIVGQVVASDSFRAATPERPKIGLVLSGGGARGASHVGVLKVLEELRVPVDIITGTSMGAIVGGLYAYGYSPSEMEKLLADIDWDEIFVDQPPRSQLNYRRKQDDQNFLIKLEAGLKNGKFVIPTGLVQGQKLNLLLKSLTLSAPQHFDELPIRYRAVAADIETGEAVVLGEGSLATAMRASLSIPGVFSPVEWNGQLLVDGGFANNVPVQLAKELGADILIVVDLSDKPRQRSELSTPLSILNQTLGFQLLRNSAEQLRELGSEDILVLPDMGTYSSTDFKHSTDMIARGVLATGSILPQLKILSISDYAYQAYQQSRHQKIETAPQIDKVVVNNQSRLGDAIIKSHIDTQAGEKLNLQSLEGDLERLYGLNIFKSVDYEIDISTDETSLLIKTIEKDWGPNYIRFGMNLESDLEGSSKFNVASSYTVTPINARGGEWRTELQAGNDQEFFTELYQPLDRRLRYYINSWARYSETHFGRYEAGRQAADYILSSSQLGLGVGRLFGNWGDFTFGVTTGSDDAEPYIGDVSVSKSDRSTGAWYIGLGYDQLDSLNFPKDGVLINIDWNSSRKGLGADVKQDRFNVTLLGARTWGKNTFILWSGLGGVVNSEIPTQSGFFIGGFFSLSGYENYELAGRYAGVLRLIYLREISGGQPVFKMPFYIGASVETGNVWNDTQDIRFDSLLAAGSLVLALDTPVGPLYLAKGFAQGGRSKSYLFLGRSFTFF